MDLSGKNVVFVAGFGGIGFEACKQLMTRNVANLTILDVKENAKAVQTLQDMNHKTKVQFIKCDVTDKTSIKSAVDQVVKGLRYIDVLVNGAGVIADRSIEFTINVNLIGLINTTMEALPYMDKSQKGRGGVILNIASVLGLEPCPPIAVYTASKFGVVGFTRSIAHTLTGHSGKVMAAKYIQEPVKVVTGSHDRTLKVWDLRSIACIETKFAGSSCNDLVTTDSLGSTIISGHYDKKIRFWDIRTEKQADDVLMNAKITSLDLSKDCNYLICSVRDDTIKLLDLRKNQVISTFSNEHFKLSCDWARASFNMNATKIACGSSDGVIYIWNVMGNLESELKGHASGSGLFHSSAVNAVSWSPNCNALASVGKGKKCLVYTES